MRISKTKIKYHLFSVLFPIFGFRKLGITGMVKIFLARYIGGLWEMNPRSYPHPMYVRGKTSDTKIFFDIISFIFFY